jgi:GTP cyclohydrolase FolE2
MNLISWDPRKWGNFGKQKLKRHCDGDESIHDHDLFSHILEPKDPKKLS